MPTTNPSRRPATDNVSPQRAEPGPAAPDCRHGTSRGIEKRGEQSGRAAPNDAARCNSPLCEQSRVPPRIAATGHRQGSGIKNAEGTALRRPKERSARKSRAGACHPGMTPTRCNSPLCEQSRACCPGLPPSTSHQPQSSAPALGSPAPRPPAGRGRIPYRHSVRDRGVLAAIRPQKRPSGHFRKIFQILSHFHERAARRLRFIGRGASGCRVPPGRS